MSGVWGQVHLALRLWEKRIQKFRLKKSKTRFDLTRRVPEVSNKTSYDDDEGNKVQPVRPVMLSNGRKSQLLDSYKDDV